MQFSMVGSFYRELRLLYAKKQGKLASVCLQLFSSIRISNQNTDVCAYQNETQLLSSILVWNAKCRPWSACENSILDRANKTLMFVLIRMCHHCLAQHQYRMKCRHYPLYSGHS